MHLLDSMSWRQFVGIASGIRPDKEVRLRAIFGRFDEDLIFTALYKKCALIADGYHRHRIPELDYGEVVLRGFDPHDRCWIEFLCFKLLRHQADGCERSQQAEGCDPF